MKKSIFKRIGLIALAVCVAIGSFFMPLKSDNDINAAHADSVDIGYTYTGKELLYLDMVVLNNGNLDPVSKPVSFSVNLLYPSINSSVNVSSTSYFINSDYRFEQPIYLDFYSWDGSFDYPVNVLLSSNSLNRYRMSSSELYSNGTWFPIYMKVNGSFNCNVTSFSVASYDYTRSFELNNPHEYNPLWGDTWYYFLNNNYNVVEITYYDNNDNSLVFQFFTLSSVNLSYRTYYIITLDNFSDNQIYNQGYQQGLADNQQNIYNNGYNAGYDIGYGNGVNAGRADANDFSFISLIGAVVDVPLQTFLGLFHFELLGINLANFILALLTVAFIIFIIKLILGSK